MKKNIFILVSLFFLSSVCSFSGEIYWEQSPEKIESMVRKIDGIIEALTSKKTLSTKQREFMFPRSSESGQWAFFSLNFDNENVQRLREVVKDSDLNPQEKKRFLHETTLTAKRRAWDELIMNKGRLPVIFPPRSHATSDISETELNRRIKEIRIAKVACFNSVKNRKSVDEIVECKKHFAKCVFNALPCSLNIFDKEVRVLYRDFCHAVLDEGEDFSRLEDSLGEDVVQTIVSRTNEFIKTYNLHKIDSTLMDYFCFSQYKVQAEE